jgi:acetyl esterase/lipase
MAVHGGTWTHGDGGKMHGYAKTIARHGFVVFKVGYTYATPERAGFPRQARELRKALRWMRANSDRFRLDPRRIGALGSSSGGNLVGLIATQGRGPLTRAGRVKAAVTWSGPLDLTRLRRHGLARSIRRFAGCSRWCRRTLRRASPITHVSRGDSAMLMFNGERELLPLSQPRSMARRLRAAGVPTRVRIVPGRRHGAKNADANLAQSIEYLREQLGHPAGGSASR